MNSASHMRAAQPMRRVVIKDGIVAGFVDEVALPLRDVETVRVSWVVPADPMLRVLFSLLRFCAGESGQVAAWTRSWRCDWLVEVQGETHGPFKDRLEAIRFEKRRVQELRRVDEYLAEATGTTSC